MIAKYRGLSLDENMKDKWIYGNLIVDAGGVHCKWCYRIE